MPCPLLPPTTTPTESRLTDFCPTNNFGRATSLVFNGSEENDHVDTNNYKYVGDGDNFDNGVDSYDDDVGDMSHIY